MIDISKEISKALTEYTQEVTEGLEKAKKESAKEGVKHLKSFSKPKRTGDYLEGWSAKEINGSWVIYNKTHAQLTHLLENGHVKRDGGRVTGYPHIRPTEEEVIKYYIKETEKVIKG
jgi:hypothetical protein